jgi:hypothetical protein
MHGIEFTIRITVEGNLKFVILSKVRLLSNFKKTGRTTIEQGWYKEIELKVSTQVYRVVINTYEKRFGHAV